MHKIFYFEFMLFISYIFYRIIANIFNLKRKDKSKLRHIKDIIDLLKYGSIIYLFVFINNQTFFDLNYALLYMISLIICGFTLQIPGVGETFPNIKKWNKNKLFMIIILLTMTYVLNKGNFIFDKRNNTILSFFIIYSMVTILIAYKKNNLKTIHPHHWQVFWVLSFLIIPKDLKTQMLSSIYLSMFAHGIICYSAASLIKDD